MPVIVASNADASHSCKKLVGDSAVMRIGRFPENDLTNEWDPRISRNHAKLFWEDGCATVSCVEGARNPIVFRGNRFKSIRVAIGDSFRIGSTTFRVVDDDPESEIRQYLEQEHQYLSDNDEGVSTQCSLNVSDHRLALISRYTPSLWLSAGDRDLAGILGGILAEVIPHARSISVVRCADPDRIREERPDILHSDSRINPPPTRIASPTPFEERSSERVLLSRPMIAASVGQGRTLVRVRPTDADSTSGRWVICSPVLADSPLANPEGQLDKRKGRLQHSDTWCLYVSGQYGAESSLPCSLSPDDLAGDVQVAELLAQLAGAIRRVRLLEDRFAGIRQFFSPAVAESVANANDSGALEPTESETAVMFCDLRGYSKMVEQSDLGLTRLLGKVNEALEVMTSAIIKHDGVIADFQGDSALGFWGWPVELEEGPLPACRAALRILRVFRRASLSGERQNLADFQVGIGIATGRAMAGRIGTKHQAKVGVFGHVVNLGSRLEGMTKRIGVPILIDGETAVHVRESLSRSEGRCRRIGLFRPVGVTSAIDVYELLPSDGQSHISDEHISIFDDAVDCFISGDWDDAINLLSQMPPKDRAKDYLLMQIAKNDYEPPDDWDGVITLKEK